MSVVYNEKRNEYRAYYGNQRKTFFSLDKYGDYAIILAKQSMTEQRRVQNYIVIENDHAVVKLFSATHGYFDVLIDIEDIDLIKDQPWYISPKGRTYYAENNSLGGMHRTILRLTNSEDIVDHIDRCGLNNQKSNLRVVGKSGNSRNIDLKSNNKTGILGVEFDGRRFIATARDFSGNKLRKHFGVKKFGFEKAKDMATAQRQKWEVEYYSLNSGTFND